MPPHSPDTRPRPTNRTRKRPSNLQLLLLALPGITALNVDTAAAAFACYEEYFYPVVARLER